MDKTLTLSQLSSNDLDAFMAQEVFAGQKAFKISELPVGYFGKALSYGVKQMWDDAAPGWEKALKDAKSPASKWAVKNGLAGKSPAEIIQAKREAVLAERWKGEGCEWARPDVPLSPELKEAKSLLALDIAKGNAQGYIERDDGTRVVLSKVLAMPDKANEFDVLTRFYAKHKTRVDEAIAEKAKLAATPTPVDPNAPNDLDALL